MYSRLSIRVSGFNLSITHWIAGLFRERYHRTPMDIRLTPLLR